MCSIAGIINPTNQKIERMLELQNHRGPDDSRVYKGENVHLGMSRLEIIDLKSPGLCLFQSGNLILSYNGEVYNYIELRQELEKKGCKFTTSSDIEVVMRSFEFWGVECFSHFNGMFALAIYDKRQKELVLARDISGEKPLYIYQKNRTFAFASEAKAFSESFDLTEKEDLSFFDAFQHCLMDTHWNEVSAVPPASYLVFDAETLSCEDPKRYWNFKQRDINLNTADEELEELLSSAVNLRTRTDVPYGLYFSGGLDSSLISTFHDFNHQYYFDDEQDWETDFKENLINVAWHLDFPVGSLSAYPLWKLAQKASQEVKVVLSGEGADEIFGGYVRYLPIANEYYLRKQFPSYNNYLFQKYFKYSSFAKGFASLTSRKSELLDIVEAWVSPYFEMFEDPINAMGYADFELVMPSLLQMGDRMASSFSIENRCPFLDKRIIEFGFSLPPKEKINNLEQKYILRKLAKKRKLDSALAMNKKGLTIHYHKWNPSTPWDRTQYFDQLKYAAKVRQR